MNLEQLVNKIKEGQRVLVKNSQFSNTLADLLVYYFEEEPESDFVKEYHKQVGKDFDYEKALILYLSLARNLDCEAQIDRFYTKIWKR